MFSEVHIDDFALSRNFTREVFDSVNAVVLQLAQIAEKHGHRLSFHSREHFARGCIEFQGVEKNTLRELESRGHEVGTHCHMSRFAEARDLVNKCGVKNNLCIVPGMVGTNVEEVIRIYRASRDLGFKFYTDAIYSDPDEAKMNALQGKVSHKFGLNPWRPNDDLTDHNPAGKMVSIDLSANPWEWKMIVFPGQEWPYPVDHALNQAEYLTTENYKLLRDLVDRQLTRVTPGEVNYFGYAFHEHQFTTDDRTMPKPVEEAFGAFDGFLTGLDKLVAEGRIKYATSIDVYSAYVDWEKKNLIGASVNSEKITATSPENSQRSPVYFEIHVAPLDSRNKEMSKQAVLRYISIFKKHGVKATFFFLPAVAQNVLNEQPDVLDALRDAGLPAYSFLGRGEGSQVTTIPVPLESVKGVEGRQLGEDLSRHIPGATGKLQMVPVPTGTLPVMPPLIKGKDFLTALPREDAQFFWCMGKLVVPPRRMGVNPGGIFAQYGVRKEMIDAGIFPKVVHPVEKLKYLLDEIPDEGFNYITLHGHEGETYFRERRGDEQEPRRPPAPVEEFWQCYEEVIALVARHPRLKVVTAEELESLARERVVPLTAERSVSADKILEAAKFIVDNVYWREQPPDYFPIDGEYWSLADTFQAVCGSLAQYAEKNELPKSVTIREIYGPLEDTRPKPGERYSLNEEGWMYQDDYPAREELLHTGQTSYPGQVGVDTRKVVFDTFWAGHNADYDVLVPGREVLDAAQKVNKEMTASVPAFIPLRSTGRALNPYEFLHVTAQELLKIHHTGSPQPVLAVKLFEIPQSGGTISITHGFHTREAREMPTDKWLTLLQLWTFKPATLVEDIQRD